MRHDDSYRNWLTAGRAAGLDGRAASPQAEGRRPAAASRPGTEGGGRPGLSGLWLLLAPLACCGGPFLIAGLAAAGALAWGGLGLGIALLLAVAVLAVRRRRRSRACCEPGAAGPAGEGRAAGAPPPGGRGTPPTPPPPPPPRPPPGPRRRRRGAPRGRG